MFSRRLAILLVSAAVCFAGAAAYAGASEPDTLFHVSVIGAISGGVYDGSLDVGTLAERGNFGLGATHALGGELVVVDGNFYQFGIDGRARLLLEDDAVTFAAVTFFDPDVVVNAQGTLSQQEIEARILELIENPNLIHAIAVRGRFSHLRARTPGRQERPYRPLSEVLADQAEYDFYDVEGTMVGFWTPSYLSSVHSPGFHFHFVADEGYASAEGAQGGHVLAFTVERAELSIDAQERLEIWFPSGDPEFQKLQL